MSIDWKAEYLKSVESGCITLDELRETRAELDATNRQVEILSDALAASRREHEPENEPFVSLASVQEPVATNKIYVTREQLAELYPPPAQPAPVQDHVATLIEHYAFTDGIVRFDGVENMEQLPVGTKFYTAAPAAQRQWVGLTDEEMYLNCPNWLSQEQCKVWIQQIEAKLKEKNT
jgi:hypothetical protein